MHQVRVARTPSVTACGLLFLVSACTTGDRPSGFDRIGVTASRESEFEVLYFACTDEAVTEVSVVDGHGSDDEGRVVWRLSGAAQGGGPLRFSPASVPTGIEEAVPAADRDGGDPLVVMVDTTSGEHQVGFELDDLVIGRVHMIGDRDLVVEEFLDDAEESC